jgi:hypothetical protein
MSAPVTSVALIDGVNVDAVAAAVTACPGVSGLFGGRGDAIATYLPGRRVSGIEVQPSTVTIHVRGRWGVSAPQLFAEIAAAVSPLLLGKRLHVVVADIDDPDPPVVLPLPAAPAVAVTDLVVLDPAVPRPPGSAPAATPSTPTPPPAFPTV